MAKNNLRPNELFTPEEWVVDPKFAHDPAYVPVPAAFTVHARDRGDPLTLADRLELLYKRPRHKVVTGHTIASLYAALDVMSKYYVAGRQGHDALQDVERILAEILGFSRREALMPLRAPIDFYPVADEAYENALTSKNSEDAP